jgi:predicted DNA binding protein
VAASRSKSRPSATPRFSGAATAHGGRGESPAEERLAVARIRITMPEAAPIGRFSRGHPEVELVFTAAQFLSPDRVLTEVEILSRDPTDYTPEISRLPDVLSAIRLGRVGPRTRYQVTLRQLPDYVPVINEWSAILRYPRIVQSGEITLEVAARVSQLQGLVRDLRASGFPLRVLRFGRDTMRTCPPTLTPRQYALLHQALAAGYFDVPRRITLTRLAGKLARSKSSISRALAQVERQLAEASAASGG